MFLKTFPQGYLLTDLPQEYSQFFDSLVRTLRRKYQNSEVEITLISAEVIQIKCFPESMLILGDFICSYCDWYLLGCYDGFTIGVEIGR